MTASQDYGSALSRASSFLLPLIDQHKQQQQGTKRPFLLAISGVQGSGKSTLTDALCDALSQPPHGLKVAAVSIDDFYLTKHDLDHLSETYPDNKLLSVRGPPGTHDVALAAQTMEALAAINDSPETQTVAIPSYDKSAFGGRGDRRPRSEWPARTAPVDVVILEGWCVGFQPLPDVKLPEAQARARAETAAGPGSVVGGSLRSKASAAVLLEHAPEHLRFMNSALREYTRGGGVTAFTTEANWDAFVHLDAADLTDVFRWRLEQEQKLRAAQGTGMTDEQVEAFSEYTLMGASSSPRNTVILMSAILSQSCDICPHISSTWTICVKALSRLGDN